MLLVQWWLPGFIPWMCGYFISMANTSAARGELLKRDQDDCWHVYKSLPLPLPLPPSTPSTSSFANPFKRFASLKFTFKCVYWTTILQNSCEQEAFKSVRHTYMWILLNWRHFPYLQHILCSSANSAGWGLGGRMGKVVKWKIENRLNFFALLASGNNEITVFHQT